MMWTNEPLLFDRPCRQNHVVHGASEQGKHGCMQKLEGRNCKMNRVATHLMRISPKDGVLYDVMILYQNTSLWYLYL